MKKMVIIWGACLTALTGFGAGSNELASALQRGLFEEEANQDLNAAIQAYRSAANLFDKDRKLAATAVFRLGECYRKQGQTNEAAVCYRRVVAEFADQTTLADLSRKYLGPGETASPTPAPGNRPASLEEMEIARIKRLVSESPDLINAKTDGSTLLHKAVGQQQLRVAEYLLANGADVNEMGVNSETALSAAVAQGNRAMVELLLSRGAAVNSRPRIPLSIAADKGFRNIAELLLEKGAGVNATGPGGGTSLHLAAANGFKSIVELLLEKGADANAFNNMSGTPLHGAANAGHEAVVDLLLKAKAKPDVTDPSGRTPLHCAAEKGYEGVAELLIAAGAKVNAGSTAPSKEGWSPLHSAAEAGYSDVCELLLRAGADPNAKASGGKSYQGHWPVTPLLVAVINSRLDAVKALLAGKADPNAATGRPIILSSIGSTPILELLLEHGANPETVLESSSGWRPLGYAASEKLPGAVEVLLKYKANPDARDTGGQTALHRALSNQTASKADETLQIVRALVQAGANVNALSNDGSTPLRYASAWIPQAAQYLKDRGAQYSAPNFSALSVTREGLDQPYVVFRKDSLGWNRYTAMEVIAEHYRGVRPGSPEFGTRIPMGGINLTSPGRAGGQLSFPDLQSLRIRRPRSPKPGDETVIELNITTNILCERDVVLEFGDIIEVPQREHSLAEQSIGLDRIQATAFDNCLARKVSILSRGTLLETPVAPDSVYLSQVLNYTGVRMFLSSNSDLSRVKVKSVHPITKEKRETVIDVQVFSNGRQPLYEDIRLRDGDVIEVPEKP